MVHAGRVAWTAADLAAMPDDPFRYELVNGRLVQTAPAPIDPSETRQRLGAALRAYADTHGGRAYTDGSGFIVTPSGEAGQETGQTVLRPAAAYVRDEDVEEDSHGYVRCAPDLAVEVVSLSQFRPAMMREKARLWLSRGCRLVWIAWPDRKKIEVWRGDGRPAHIVRPSDDLDGMDALPGFRCAVADIFSDI